MSGKITSNLHENQIRCDFNDISNLSETKKITFNSYDYNFLLSIF